MPGPRSNPFPRSTRSMVWDQLCLALQTDPVLQSRVDTWQLWRGAAEDLLEPSDDDMPLLRMTPMSGQSGWLDENTHQFRWPVRLTLGVGGTDVRAILDFWGAVESALFTGNDLLERLYPSGVIQKTISSPSVEPHLFGDAAGLMAEGTISILMRINT